MNVFGVLITVKRISSVFLGGFFCFRHFMVRRVNLCCASVERLSSWVIRMYALPFPSES